MKSQPCYTMTEVNTLQCFCGLTLTTSEKVQGFICLCSHIHLMAHSERKTINIKFCERKAQKIINLYSKICELHG